MSKVFIGLIALLSFTGIGYVGVQAFTNNPCLTPKTYSILSVDPRFNLSTSTLLSYTTEAASLWNKQHASSTLLSYKEQDGSIGISLVYDERQRTTIENERLQQTIENEREELSDIKQTIESLRSEFRSIQAEIDTRSTAYSAKLERHNDEVARWNEEGGAPTSVYQRLERERASLETERKSLNAKINRYNYLAEQIRQYAQGHNEVVEDINEKIGTLNEHSLREFEEGTYDPNTKTITIYEFDSPTALKRVLAHELGHALGIGHVEDENAIMYPVNQSKALTLTQADTAALSNVCREKNLDDALHVARLIRDDIARLALWTLSDTAVPQE